VEVGRGFSRAARIALAARASLAMNRACAAAIARRGSGPERARLNRMVCLTRILCDR